MGSVTGKVIGTVFNAQEWHGKTALLKLETNSGLKAVEVPLYRGLAWANDAEDVKWKNIYSGDVINVYRDAFSIHVSIQERSRGFPVIVPEHRVLVHPETWLISKSFAREGGTLIKNMMEMARDMGRGDAVIFGDPVISRHNYGGETPIFLEMTEIHWIDGGFVLWSEQARYEANTGDEAIEMFFHPPAYSTLSITGDFGAIFCEKVAPDLIRATYVQRNIYEKSLPSSRLEGVGTRDAMEHAVKRWWADRAP